MLCPLRLYTLSDSSKSVAGNVLFFTQHSHAPFVQALVAMRRIITYVSAIHANDIMSRKLSEAPVMGEVEKSLDCLLFQ